MDTFADFFVFCSGNSDRQLDALQESILESAKKNYRAIPWSKEGSGDAEWLLLDYSDVIVHLFSPAKRSFYNLEELWKEGKVLLHIQ